jgi:GTP-binding protein EngB required for normal cell division
MDDLKFNEKTQEFSTETLPRILIVAKSQAGKSWLIKELLF